MTASRVWRSRISMRPLRAGDREPRRGRQDRGQARAPLRLPAPMVRHPQRFPLCGLPAVWWFVGTAFAIPVNRYSRRFEIVQSGCLSQQGCQLTPTCQRRNWRVRRVERGQRSEPAWLRAHPSRNHFELEKPVETQIPWNVWDRRTAGTSDAVNKLTARKLQFRRVAQFKPDKLRLTANRNTLQTR